MPLEAIAYVSSATRPLRAADLETLLLKARERNLQHGVTGSLLHDEGAFFQYFEGPPEGMAVVYEHIQRSDLHRGIVELMRLPVTERCFPDWTMGFTLVPRAQLLELAHADWQQRLNQGAAQAEPSRGMALLLRFWRHSSGRGRGVPGV